MSHISSSIVLFGAIDTYCNLCAQHQTTLLINHPEGTRLCAHFSFCVSDVNLLPLILQLFITDTGQEKQVSKIMGNKTKGKRGHISGLFSIGLIAVGSLFTFVGSFCSIYYYPTDCSFSSDFLLCSPRQVLLLMAIITCFSSGEGTKKESKAPRPAKNHGVIKKSKKNPVSTTYIITDDIPQAVKETKPRTVYYSPPLCNMDQNLILSSKSLNNGGPYGTTNTLYCYK
ncbi:uncharacterized protein [Macrobrachium rosenbergii]|uniref:uncharacterized protein isoform X2 n=1 Tax=Macrobrachium rosenbergii TaxID=79674 RepID=UPI0034D438C6